MLKVLPANLMRIDFSILLGNGETGTDVRVRNNRLHCQNCYSNDEGNFNFNVIKTIISCNQNYLCREAEEGGA